MAPDDYCRLCKVNMRETGPRVYAHSTHMFVTKTPPSISERLAMMELIVAPEPQQSSRCCQRCTTTLGRLEKDLPLLRQWEENIRGGSRTQSEPSLSEIPGTLKKSCPNPLSPPASSLGNTTTTKVIINYPSQTLRRECQPEESPIIKSIALRKWKEAASHALKHRHLQEELKAGVIKLIRKECDVLCSRRYDFVLWKCEPAELKEFSFRGLRDDLRRLAPFLLSILSCVTNDNNLASCTAAAIAIRGRQPRLSALSYYISIILQRGGAKKSVFSHLSKLCITTCYKRAARKQGHFAPGFGADFESDLKAADSEESDGAESLEDLEDLEDLDDLEDFHQSGVQSPVPAADPSLEPIKEEPEEVQIKAEIPEITVTVEEEFVLEEMVKEEKTEDTDGAEAEDSSDTDDSGDWTEREMDPAQPLQPPHHKEKTHFCHLCGKGFTSPEYVRKHLIVHTEGKLHVCDQCGKEFSTAIYLKRHQVVHTKEKPYECELCHKVFKRLSTLKLHMSTHTEEKLYSCDQCRRKFITLRYLKKHMLVHTEVKPYECELCPKVYRRPHELQRHMRSHTDKREEKTQSSHIQIQDRIYDEKKPFMCDLCGKSFSRKANLELHKRVHTGEKPFGCEECGKAFVDSSTLKKHQRTHTGEKPYECLQCGVAFFQSWSLTVHMRTHTGEKPYKCELCDKAFPYSASLKEHMRSGHREASQL